MDRHYSLNGIYCKKTIPIDPASLESEKSKSFDTLWTMPSIEWLWLNNYSIIIRRSATGQSPFLSASQLSSCVTPSVTPSLSPPHSVSIVILVVLSVHRAAFNVKLQMLANGLAVFNLPKECDRNKSKESEKFSNFSKRESPNWSFDSWSLCGRSRAVQTLNFRELFGEWFSQLRHSKPRFLLVEKFSLSSPHQQAHRLCWKFEFYED